MPLPVEELEPLLRLALVPGVGPHRLTALIERFGSAERAMAVGMRELRGVRGIGAELARRIGEARGTRAREESRRAMVRLARARGVALTIDDKAYPPSFRKVHDPPYLLFASGDLGLLDRPGIAVVGTRSPTAYGRSAASRLSCELAGSGLVIISGLARGIDSAAHQGALEAGGATIAVLGNGIDQLYPPENGLLFRALRERGLLLSEFLPGETPKAGNFPRRNRLIAALSLAVLVVEMGHRSGAQHTVDYALAEGKEVLAVPGPISSPASLGTNQLIQDGARLVASAHDVIEELWGVGTEAPSLPPHQSAAPGVASAADAQLSLLEPTERQLLETLAEGPLHVQEIIATTRERSAAVLATLLQLELRGFVSALPGSRYRRTDPGGARAFQGIL